MLKYTLLTWQIFIGKIKIIQKLDIEIDYAVGLDRFAGCLKKLLIGCYAQHGNPIIFGSKKPGCNFQFPSYIIIFIIPTITILIIVKLHTYVHNY